MKERTTEPVPTIFGYVASARNEVGAPFMLMECLKGNVATGLKFDSVPAEHRAES